MQFLKINSRGDVYSGLESTVNKRVRGKRFRVNIMPYVVGTEDSLLLKCPELPNYVHNETLLIESIISQRLL